MNGDPGLRRAMVVAVGAFGGPGGGAVVDPADGGSGAGAGRGGGVFDDYGD